MRKAVPKVLSSAQGLQHGAYSKPNKKVVNLQQKSLYSCQGWKILERSVSSVQMGKS